VLAAAAAAASEASIGAPVTSASFNVPASSSKPSPGELPALNLCCSAFRTSHSLKQLRSAWPGCGVAHRACAKKLQAIKDVASAA
jgi:hypothetical protein